MDDASFDVPNPGRGGRGSASGRRIWRWLLAGALVGLAAGLLLPGLAGPYLPGFLGGGTVTVEGQVLSKQRAEERLLLTVEADRGAVLATFRERVAELDLLVAEGDSITLRVREFRPFVENPTVVAVRKFPSGPQRGEGASEEGGRGARTPAREAAPAGETPAGADTGGVRGS